MCVPLYFRQIEMMPGDKHWLQYDEKSSLVNELTQH